MTVDQLEVEQHVARQEAAPAALAVGGLEILLALVSWRRGWTLYGTETWWPWLVLALPALVLAGTFALGLGRLGVSSEHRRRVAAALLTLLVAANVAGIVMLVGSLLTHGAEVRGGQLLASAAVMLVVNMLTFGLVFWELDCGGPVRRRLAPHRTHPDFQFPQDENPQLAPDGWRPGLGDYVYLALTNSIAFSPTDAMPLTQRAKLAMGVESVIAATTVLIIAARAINILH